MKLRVGEYDIEIKAKHRYTSRGRNNISDAIGILNTFSLALSLAAKQYKAQGYNKLSDNMKNMADDIYESLDKVGAYRDI